MRALDLDQVGDVEHRLAEEAVGALRFEREQAALDRTDRRSRDVAVGSGELRGVLAHVLQDGAQVLDVEQQEPGVVGDLEDEIEHAFLRVVQAEQAREQQRPHVRDGRAHRVARRAVDVPEHHRAGFVP
jgi:hypothetical protein